MAWELEFTSMILEGDAKAVFTSFGARDRDLSHTSTILQDAIHVTFWSTYFKAYFVDNP